MADPRAEGADGMTDLLRQIDELRHENERLKLENEISWIKTELAELLAFSICQPQWYRIQVCL